MAYGKDASELVVASNGSINVAPVGSTLPTAVTASLAAAFVDLGYASEDGVTLNVAPEINEFGAWQSRQPVRRELAGQEVTLSFALEQWNANTVKLSFGGGTITNPSGGTYRYELPEESAALEEKALVVDWQDGPSRSFRLVCPRGNVTEGVETNLVRSGLALLPITFKALEQADGSTPAYILSNDVAFGTGS